MRKNWLKTEKTITVTLHTYVFTLGLELCNDLETEKVSIEKYRAEKQMKKKFRSWMEN